MLKVYMCVVLICLFRVKEVSAQVVFTITSKEIGYCTNKRKGEKCIRNHDDTYMNA